MPLWRGGGAIAPPTIRVEQAVQGCPQGHLLAQVTAVRAYEQFGSRTASISTSNYQIAALCGTQNHAYDAIANEVPQGDEELARQCDDHLARATIVLDARFKPLGQGTLLLKVEEAPGELDHPFPHSSVAGSGKSLLAAFLPALVGRAREASVARHSAPVAQVARQDLLGAGFRPYQTALVACITVPQQVTSLIITADEKSGSHLGGQPKSVKSNSHYASAETEASFGGLL